VERDFLEQYNTVMALLQFMYPAVGWEMQFVIFGWNSKGTENKFRRGICTNRIINT